MRAVWLEQRHASRLRYSRSQGLSYKSQVKSTASRCLAEALQAKFDHEAEGTTADGAARRPPRRRRRRRVRGGSWWQPAVH